MGRVFGETCLETDILFKILVEIAHLTWRHIYFSPQLSVPAQINAYVQPATLPTVDTPELYGGAICTVSGWGVTRIYSFYLSPILRAVDVSIMSNCQYYYYYRVNDNMVCAGSRFGGKDACQVIRGLNANENFPNPGGSNGIERNRSRHFFSGLRSWSIFLNIQTIQLRDPTLQTLIKKYIDKNYLFKVVSYVYRNNLCFVVLGLSPPESKSEMGGVGLKSESKQVESESSLSTTKHYFVLVF